MTKVAPLGLHTSPSIFMDTFDRADGPIGGGWTDAYDVEGSDYWNQTTISGGQIVQYGVVQNTWGATPDDFDVAHNMCVREIGVSDNFEVGLAWYIDPSFSSTDVYFARASQPHPAIFCDLEAADDEQTGIVGVYDIAAAGGSCYIHNTFRVNPISECLDPTLYDTFTSGGTSLNWTKIRAGRQWSIIRVRNGMMRYYFNDKPRTTSDGIAVPGWASGRTQAGFHIVTIEDGDESPELPTPTIVEAWYWRPFFGVL